MRVSLLFYGQKRFFFLTMEGCVQVIPISSEDSHKKAPGKHQKNRKKPVTFQKI
jgi:hypothetical protein